jgi:hypothetical protein
MQFAKKRVILNRCREDLIGAEISACPSDSRAPTGGQFR